MAGDGPAYPIPVDTDGLVGVATSPLWELFTVNLGSPRIQSWVDTV